MNRLFFLRAPLSRALGLLAATLMLNACERVWDNPADPEAPSYQGYTSVKTANEIEAVTPDGTEMIYQSFLVNEVLEAQAYRLEIATDKQFSNVIYMKNTFTSNFLGAKASLNRGPTYYWRGAAKKHDAWGKWTEGRGFKLGGSITPMKPASGSSTTDTTPTFSWTAVTGADEYQIQIADSAASLEINPTVDDKNVSGTSYTPTMALTNLQTHHWRVRAVDGEEQAGAWSGTQTLNINFDTVSGLNPANGSSTTDITPEFSWTAVTGATRYEIQIADSEADLEINPTVDDKNVPGTSYTPTALTNKQTHHWRVRAVDGDGQPGAWSGTQTLNVNFDTVSGLDPTDGSSTTDTTPTFRWTAVAGADKYQIQIADSAANLAGSSTVDAPGASYTPTTALTNLLTHHWRVRAVDSEGQFGTWSGASSLRVEWGAVSGLNPANGSSTTNTKPTLRWNAVTGASSYEIQIADSAANLAGSSAVNVPGTSYTPTTALTNKQTHHWRVRAVDSEGQFGAWSGASSLRVEWGTVSGLNPANGSDTTNTKPTLRWNAVTGASSYEIQIADSAANLAGSSAVNVPGTSYTPTTALTNLLTHHWRVRAVDSEGQFGAWSGASSLRVEWGTVSGLNPANGSDTTNTKPTLRWNAVTGASSYEIQIADSAANLAGSSAVNVPGTSYTPTTALTNLLTHHWRVRAVDSEGQFGTWSGASSLRVEWGAVSGLNPANGSSTMNSTPSLVWNAVNGAAKYEVQIADTRADVASTSPITVTTATYTWPNTLSAGDKLYWRVRALDGNGQKGVWSATIDLTYNPFSAPNWSFQPVIAPGATGTFNMGSNNGESREKPVHSVTLTRAYAMNTHEVTNAQYAAVMNKALDRSWVTASTSALRNVSGNQQELLDIDDSDCRIDYSGGNLVVQSGYGDHPVLEVTWYGAVAFAYYLNELEGREQTYSLGDWGVDHAKAGYRLPTEAEWEYAARGGASSRGYTYAGSNTVGDVGWYSGNSGSSTHPVGEKQANELGLYDMSGNVYEWCWDWYGGYSSGSQTDPAGPSTGSYRVLRGGSWNYFASYLRSASRLNGSPGNSFSFGGFRLVRPAVL